MKSRKRAIVNLLYFFLAFFLIISNGMFVDAAWVEWIDKRENTWVLDQETHWKTADQDGWQTYHIRWNNTGIENFTQWSFKASVWGYGRGPYIFDRDMESHETFTLEGNASTKVELIVSYRYERELWFWDRDVAHIELAVNETDVADDAPPSGIYGYPIIAAWFFQDSYDSDILKVQVRVYYEDGTVEGGFDYDVNVGSSWFDSVDLEQKVETWGEGWMEGTKTDEIIRQNDAGSGTTEDIPTEARSLIQDLIRVVGNLWQSVKENMPKPVQDFMNTLEMISGAVWTVMYLTYSIVIAVLPLLGVIVGFYFLQAGMNSIYDQSTEPLMQAVTRFYQLFQGFANTAINIVKTIWGFIKFW